MLRQQFDTSYSGSTVVSVLLIGQKLVCANVGDSRAILASWKTKGNTKTWIVAALSRDHKATLPDEHSRILKHNGRLATFKGIISDIF